MIRVTIDLDTTGGWARGGLFYRGIRVNATWLDRTAEQIIENPWDGLKFVHVYKHPDDVGKQDSTVCLTYLRHTQRTVYFEIVIGGELWPIFLPMARFTE